MPNTANSNPPPDPNDMISYATYLQSLTKQMQTLPNQNNTDVFYFYGYIHAVPVLLALATEIALKAWIVLERKPLPTCTHHLLKLFNTISPTNQDNIIRSFTISPIFLHQNEKPNPQHNFHRILKEHSSTFKHWRYIYEGNPPFPRIPAMHAALTAIITAYP